MASSNSLIRGGDWAPRLLELLNSPPADAIAWMETQTRPLKADTWSRVGLLQVRGEWCFAKLYLAKTAWQRLGFRLGYGRAVHSFDAAVKLAAAGLPVPEPRACLRVPAGMLLLTAGFPAAQDLRALWLGEPGNDLAPQLLRRSAELLAGLHGAGFAHGDCKWSNLLWLGEQFYLVDLEAVRKLGGGRGFHPRQARDLARFTIDAEALGLGRELYQLFLDTYLASSGYPRDLVLQRVLPLVETIRARHLSKYGVANEPLL
jgi:tRNA A-37 threonylcarbamoyl transferase component Bud32